MKKSVIIVAIIMVIGLLACCTIACEDKSTETLPDDTQEDSYTHTVKINTAEKFNHYFSCNITSSNPYYSDTVKSTIKISSKLKGFVEYSGKVSFSASSEEEGLSEQVLKERTVSIDSYGDGEDIYELTKDRYNDNSISFSSVSFSVKSVDITLIYHHDGASGNKELTYQSISLTNYNYREYLEVEITNRISTSSEEEQYQQILISSVNSLNGLYEFNNVILTFDNGITIKLDALGYAEYTGENMTETPRIPKVTGITGGIDFYPPATYEYQTENSAGQV